MKISIRQYAQALYDLTENKSEKEIPEIIASFLNQLNRNNNLKIADKIIAKFKDIYNQKHGIVEAEVTSREKINTEVYTQVYTYVSTKYKVKEVVINNKIDSNIKGGIIIKVEDEILDASIKNHLNNLSKLLKV